MGWGKPIFGAPRKWEQSKTFVGGESKIQCVGSGFHCHESPTCKSRFGNRPHKTWQRKVRTAALQKLFVDAYVCKEFLFRSRWGQKSKVVCANSILSVACWGWIMKSLSDNKVEKLKTGFGNALWRPEPGSPDLHQLLTGHMADPQFRAGTWAARMWPSSNVVANWLKSLRWQKQANGSFLPDLGNRFSIDHVNSEEIRHWLQESWRRIKWNLFIYSGRRDTDGLTERSFDEPVCKATRKAFHQTDSHGRAVLVGAPCGDAMYDIIGDLNPPSFCVWCIQSVCPTWHHHAWECKAFRKTRPPVPGCAMVGCYCWGVVPLVGCHCWMPLLGAMVGWCCWVACWRHSCVPWWGAISGWVGRDWAIARCHRGVSAYLFVRCNNHKCVWCLCEEALSMWLYLLVWLDMKPRVYSWLILGTSAPFAPVEENFSSHSPPHLHPRTPTHMFDTHSCSHTRTYSFQIHTFWRWPLELFLLGSTLVPSVYTHTWFGSDFNPYPWSQWP